MIRTRLFRLISLLLVIVIVVDAGPRYIIESNLYLRRGQSIVSEQPSVSLPEMDQLLQQLAAVVTQPSPDVDDIVKLVQQLTAQHEQVLAYFQAQFQHLEALNVPETVLANQAKARVDYLARYEGLQQHLTAVINTPTSTQLQAVADYLATYAIVPTSDETTAIPPRQIITDAATPISLEGPAPAPKNRTGKRPLRQVDTLPGPADLAETIEVQFTPDIVQLAASLNHNPVEIYNWVHNEIAFTPVWGSIQGAQHCLETRVCNAFDTSSLVIALLRVSGIPARYQMGRVAIPVDAFMNWAGGFTSPEAAASLFASAGVPEVVRRTDATGQVVSVRLQHVWVKAYVDYMPSRGMVHIEGDTWLDIDAAFKQHTFPSRADWSQFVNASLADPLAFRDQLLATAVTDPLTGGVSGIDTTLLQTTFQPDEDTAYDILVSTQPSRTVGELLGRKQIEPRTIPILLADLPYTVLAETDNTAALTAAWQHQLTIRVATSLVFTRTLPEIAGARLTIGYAPATAADRDILRAYYLADPDDLPLGAPAGLFDVVPTLQIDNQVVLTGTAVPLGSPQQLSLELDAPTIQTPIVHNQITAGEVLAIGLNVQEISSQTITSIENRLSAIANAMLADPDTAYFDPLETQALMLQAIILNWFTQADFVNQVFADQSRVVTLRYPSVGLAMADYAPGTLFGAPTSLSFNSVALDIDRDMVVTLSLDDDQTAVVNHSLITGMIGSQLEAVLPATHLFPLAENANAYWLATASTLASAMELDDTMVLITPANVAQVVPLLDLSPAELVEIQDALVAGRQIFLHQTPLVDQDDVAFTSQIHIDPTNGSAAYLIAGLGGSTATSCAADGDDSLLDRGLATDLFMGVLFDKAADAVEKLWGAIGNAGGLANKFLNFAKTVADFASNTLKTEQAIGQIGPSAKPLMGLAILFAALDVLKTFTLSGNAGSAAGAYLTMISWTAYKMAAQIIGRIAEINAASNGIILPPGCLAKKIFS